MSVIQDFESDKLFLIKYSYCYVSLFGSKFEDTICYHRFLSLTMSVIQVFTV